MDSTQPTVRLPRELYAQLREIAKAERRSLAQTVTLLLEKQIAIEALSELKEARKDNP